MTEPTQSGSPEPESLNSAILAAMAKTTQDESVYSACFDELQIKYKDRVHEDLRWLLSARRDQDSADRGISVMREIRMVVIAHLKVMARFHQAVASTVISDDDATVRAKLSAMAYARDEGVLLSMCDILDKMELL